MDNKPKTVIVEGLGYVADTGEESYLQLENEFATMRSLFLYAGAEVIREHLAQAFVAKTNEHWSSRRVAYQQQSQRKNPKVYRVKLVLEVEEVAQEETDRFWDRAAQKYEDYAGEGSGH